MPKPLVFLGQIVHPDRIELLPDALRAQGLARHDERPSDVTIPDEAFSIGNAEGVRYLKSARPAGIRNRNHYIQLGATELLAHLFREVSPHVQSRRVDRSPVDHRIGSCQINKFKNAKLTWFFLKWKLLYMTFLQECQGLQGFLQLLTATI